MPHNRLLHAVKGAWHGFLTAWQGAQYPLEDSPWDLYDARLLRYLRCEHYANNTIYTRNINRYATTHIQQENLYSFIRGMKNPVSRQIKVYRDKVYPGGLDYSSMETGALPLKSDNLDMLFPPILQLLLWSNWMTEKALYVGNGATYGDTFLKVLDEPEKRRTRLEVLSPRMVKEVRKDPAGNIKEIYIEYERLKDPEGEFDPTLLDRAKPETVTVGEYITPERFEFYEDGEKKAEDGYDNAYGFVPVTHAAHYNTGLMFGATAYQDSLAKIDELNSAMSMLSDQIGKVTNPVWGVSGASSASDFTQKRDTSDGDIAARQSVMMLYGPDTAQWTPLVFPLDIPGAMEYIRAIQMEIEQDMPELALHTVRDKAGELSGVAIRNLYDDAISRISAAQANYDDALIRAIQMALTIGKLGSYENFEAIPVNAYERGLLDFHIGSRPVFRDELSKEQKVTFLLQTGAPASAIWTELGYEAKIEDWKAELDSTEEAQEEAVTSAIERLAARGEDDEDEAVAMNGNGRREAVA